jgi:MFS family permease
MFNLFFWKKPKNSLIVLYLMAFFLALAGALPAYIQSSFLETYVGLSAVNWFFIIANAISIIAILFFPQAIKRFGNYLTTGLVSLMFLVALTGLGLCNTAPLIFLFFILMQIAINLIWINMDIFVKSFSSISSTGRIRAIYFTVINFAWIVSPTISAWLISLSGYYGAFLGAAFLIIPFLIIFLLKGSQIDGHQNYKTSFLKSLKEMYKNHNLRGAFWLAMLLNVFFNAAVVFIPIYLNRVIGFSWTELGLVFSLMLIPFMFVEIPAGFIADKYLGEKEMFGVGFVIIIVCLCFFTISTSNNIWFWAALLFISRIGAALVEAMRESYFFKIVSNKDVDKINLFRTAIPFGYLVGSLISLITLIFFPISYIFLITAIFTCSAFPFLAIIKDTK